MTLLLSIVSYLESDRYLALVLLLVFLYILLREGLKHAGEHYGFLSFFALSVVFAFFLFLHLYLDSAIIFLAMVLVFIFSVEKERLEEKKEAKRRARAKKYAREYQSKYGDDE